MSRSVFDETMLPNWFTFGVPTRSDVFLDAPVVFKLAVSCWLLLLVAGCCCWCSVLLFRVWIQIPPGFTTCLTLMPRFQKPYLAEQAASSRGLWCYMVWARPQLAPNDVSNGASHDLQFQSGGKIDYSRVVYFSFLAFLRQEICKSGLPKRLSDINQRPKSKTKIQMLPLSSDSFSQAKRMVWIGMEMAKLTGTDNDWIRMDKSITISWWLRRMANKSWLLVTALECLESFGIPNQCVKLLRMAMLARLRQRFAIYHNGTIDYKAGPRW